jgi:hypothetical protein
MKKPKRKPAKPKTLAYIQDWGTYTNETLVVVGMNQKQILAALVREGAIPDIVEAYGYVKPEDYESDGFIWTYKGCTVLWLEDWKYDAAHLDTLVHETNHLVYNMMVKRKKMKEEMEAQAYQQAYLFSAILKRLNQRFRGRK